MHIILDYSLSSTSSSACPLSPHRLCSIQNQSLINPSKSMLLDYCFHCLERVSTFSAPGKSLVLFKMLPRFISLCETFSPITIQAKLLHIYLCTPIICSILKLFVILHENDQFPYFSSPQNCDMLGSKDHLSLIFDSQYPAPG